MLTGQKVVVEGAWGGRKVDKGRGMTWACRVCVSLCVHVARCSSPCCKVWGWWWWKVLIEIRGRNGAEQKGGGRGGRLAGWVDLCIRKGSPFHQLTRLAPRRIKAVGDHRPGLSRFGLPSGYVQPFAWKQKPLEPLAAPVELLGNVRRERSKAAVAPARRLLSAS